MTKEEQVALLTTFVEQVRQVLVAKADRWPEDWDGHELRELVAYAFQYERTRLMLEKRSRRRLDCKNTIIVDNLY